MRQRIRYVGTRLDSCLFDEFLVGTVCDAERDAHTQDVLRERPVRQAGRDEFRVRHDDIDIVVRVDQRAPHIDSLDRAGKPVIQFDVVADAQGALEQDNQARDEVVHD